MNVQEMIQSALREAGADGLCNSDGQCGCGIDEIAPCECLNVGCIAAKHIRPKSDDPGYWDEWPEGYYTVMECQ